MAAGTSTGSAGLCPPLFAAFGDLEVDFLLAALGVAAFLVVVFLAVVVLGVVLVGVVLVVASTVDKTFGSLGVGVVVHCHAPLIRAQAWPSGASVYGLV